MSGVAMLGASSRSKRRWVACLAAGLLLFTQFVMASQACTLAKPGLAQQAMAVEDCDGTAMQKAVCQAHCAAADQAGLSLDQHFAFVPTADAITAAAFPSHRVRVPFGQSAALRAAGPPLRVLYCSYQI